MKRLIAVALYLVALAACGSGDSDPGGADDPPPASTPPTTISTPTPTPAATQTPSGTAARWNLPKGFPKVVAVSSLPDQVRNWYQMSDKRKAVALAPGVWAEMPPGATMYDAIMAGVFDGFCGSKKAFERKYLDGYETAGTCW